MKKRNIISVLVLTMAIGMGVTAYAASNDSPAAASPTQRLGLGRITSMRGYDYISNILKSKLGLSDADIASVTSSGKMLHDIATEKGMTQDDLKAALLEERTKAIDTAVSGGKITKEEGEILKANLNTKIENCTGNFGQRQALGRGQDRGMMRNGQCGYNQVAPSN